MINTRAVLDKEKGLLLPVSTSSDITHIIGSKEAERVGSVILELQKFNLNTYLAGSKLMNHIFGDKSKDARDIDLLAVGPTEQEGLQAYRHFNKIYEDSVRNYTEAVKRTFLDGVPEDIANAPFADTETMRIDNRRYHIDRLAKIADGMAYVEGPIIGRFWFRELDRKSSPIDVSISRML